VRAGRIGAVVFEERFEQIGLLRFEKLAGFGQLAHAVTTKPWNLAAHCGPARQAAGRFRRRVCAALRVPFERLTTAEQVHQARVAYVGPDRIGAGRTSRQTAIASADGLITDQPDVPLLVLSADCPLVLVVDPAREILGVAHASRRSTLLGIVPELIGQFRARFGTRPDDLWAGIGPGAGPCCYRVGQDVVAELARYGPDGALYLRGQGEDVRLDLWRLIVDQLCAAGVPAGQIELAGLCTICDDRFFSYRREGSETGRFGLFCAIRASGQG